MKTKPKRIRAKVLFTDSDGVLWKERVPQTERAYLLRQSDIRALAEQFVEDMYFYGTSWEKSMLYALKRAGITPGKEAK